MPNRGYLWQRHWTPAVQKALAEACDKMQDVILLCAELEWREGKPLVIRSSIDWEQVRRHDKACALALRVAPIASRLVNDNEILQNITAIVRSLLAEARANGVQPRELQLDYDCPQKSLHIYHQWLVVLRGIVHPVRLTITTLPAWLDEPEFARIVHEVDGWVLQVHSVPTSKMIMAKLCDPAAARRWVTKAARLHSPFSVALPTYRCAAGYDEGGRLLGAAMDGVQPKWPPGTRLLDFSANADETADLTNEWLHARPPELRALIWYRLPVSTDIRNWGWPTLSAVMAGRKPQRRFVVTRDGENPVDLALRNIGESDDSYVPAIVARWTGSDLVASDALFGFEFSRKDSCATFRAGQELRVRLPPGALRHVGWLRFAGPVQLTLETTDDK